MALHDAYVSRIATEKPGALVAWWLIAAYAYDVLDHPVISDALFDEIAHRLADEWDSIEHRHKHLIDRTMTKSALGMMGKWPLIVESCAGRLTRMQPDEVIEFAARMKGSAPSQLALGV